MKIKTALINSKVTFLIEHEDRRYSHTTAHECESNRWDFYSNRFKHDFDANLALDNLEVNIQQMSVKKAVLRKNNTLDGIKINLFNWGFLSHLESDSRWVDTAKLLRRFNPDTNWADMEQDYVLNFKNWLLLRAKKKDGTHYAVNTFSQHYLIMKAAMKSAIRDGNSLAHEKMFGLRVKREQPVDVYLNHEELEVLEHVKLNPKLDAVRVMFLIGAYSGARISDFKTLSSVNMSNGVLKYMSQKTGVNISAPIHPYVKKHLELGLAGLGKDITEKTETKYFNDRIKQACMIAGIDEEVLTYSKVAGKAKGVIKKKWELVHSHTARKTFATNLAISGTPAIAIQKMLGHQSISVTSGYILATADDFIAQVASSSYFTEKKSKEVREVVVVKPKDEEITAVYDNRPVTVIGKGLVPKYSKIRDESGEVFNVSDDDLYFG